VQEVRYWYISCLSISESTPSKSRALSEESARGSRSVQEVRDRYISILNIGESTPASHVLTLRSPHVGRAQFKRYGTGTLAA
jgi:hypothetical protein